MRLKTDISTLQKAHDFCRDLGAHNHALGTIHGMYYEKEGDTVELIPNMFVRNVWDFTKTFNIRLWSERHDFEEIQIIL